MALQIGQFLQKGRYEVIGHLGKGGMGTVYLAQDHNLLQRKVALKENIDVSPQTQEQFQLEAVLLANLTHPNLPRVTDHFIEDSGRQYLVMDYIDGLDLNEVISALSEPMPKEQVLEWIRQVFDALHYMHTRVDPTTQQLSPIIHRDIKPSNIKRTPNDRIVLVDFGLAKDENLTQKTDIGARAVSPGYSPIEQYTGGTDTRSDIYALGATLYRLLTLQTPPSSPARAAGTEMVHPRESNPQISQNMAEVILCAMAIKPDDRFQTILEMQFSLNQAVLQDGVSTIRSASANNASGDALIQHDSPRNNSTHSTSNQPSTAEVTTSSPSETTDPTRMNQTRTHTSFPLEGKSRMWFVSIAMFGFVMMSYLLLSDIGFLDKLSNTGEVTSGNLSNNAVALATGQPTRQTSTAQSIPTDISTLSTTSVQASFVVTSTKSTPSPPDTSIPTGTLVSISTSSPSTTTVPMTLVPSETPTKVPTRTNTTTSSPTNTTTSSPTNTTTSSPTNTTTSSPTSTSTATNTPTIKPTNTSTLAPTSTPTIKPTNTSTLAPTSTSTSMPTRTPTVPPKGPPIPEAGERYKNPIDGALYVAIPEGPFERGSTDSKNATPVLSINVSGFWIMETEVTNAQYTHCIVQLACTEPANDHWDLPEFADHPVNYVAWEQAQQYAEWAGGRLPTEAEWEKSAKGTEALIYPWGDEQPNKELLNYSSRYADPSEGENVGTVPVKSYLQSRSPYGLFDMAGNVSEWTLDWFDSDYYANSPLFDPLGPDAGIFKVIRGGAFNSAGFHSFRTSERETALPQNGAAKIGFRVVLTTSQN